MILDISKEHQNSPSSGSYTFLVEQTHGTKYLTVTHCSIWPALEMNSLRLRTVRKGKRREEERGREDKRVRKEKDKEGGGRGFVFHSITPSLYQGCWLTPQPGGHQESGPSNGDGHRAQSCPRLPYSPLLL